MKGSLMAALPDSVRIGTRGSALARWQTVCVAGLLRAAYPGLKVEIVVMTTRGDLVLDTPLPQIGGKGVFTAELEDALRSSQIDLAVHSLKDLPTDDPDGIVIGAIPPRGSIEDALVSRAGHTLEALPEGAVVGTSSRRRAGQLLHARHDLRCIDLRGNVDTRLRKALDPDGQYDAIVLAQAGLERLDRGDAISQTLPHDVMLPAPGQGALAVQCRDEEPSLALLEPLDHTATRVAVTAERAFLSGLGGGCSVPVAAYGSINGGSLTLLGRVTSMDGSQQIDVNLTDDIDISASAAALRAGEMGHRLAEKALQEGVASILEEIA
jgi:hydroxymethylbilane synthase